MSRRRPLLHIPPGRLASRHARRINRQLELIARNIPAMERPMRAVLRPSLWPVRLPIAILLTIGGLLSFLPVLGLWMLPLGLLLLAVDLPFLRPTIGWASVRSRRWFSTWRRNRRDAKGEPEP